MSAPTRCRSTPPWSPGPRSSARWRRSSALSAWWWPSTPAAAPATARPAGVSPLHGGRIAHVARCRRLGGRGAGCGRDPPHVDGSRRHLGRLRPGAHRGGRRRRLRARDRLGRGRHARSPGRRGARRSRRRGAGCAPIFHFGEHTVGEAKTAMANGISVRFELGRLVPRLPLPASRIRLSVVGAAPPGGLRSYGRGVGDRLRSASGASTMPERDAEGRPSEKVAV